MEIQRQATARKLPGPALDRARGRTKALCFTLRCLVGSGGLVDASSKVAEQYAQWLGGIVNGLAQGVGSGQRLGDRVEQLQQFGEAIGHFFVIDRDGG